VLRRINISENNKGKVSIPHKITLHFMYTCIKAIHHQSFIAHQNGGQLLDGGRLNRGNWI